MSITYKDAGVSRERGYATAQHAQKAAKKTYNNRVISGIGGFSALYDISAEQYKDPILATGTDGVGTKLLLARKHKALHGIGQDCVAMCVNDVLCSGAKPLFFLDYLAYSSLHEQEISLIIQGIADACEKTNCALIGGETAEMPTLYAPHDFDVAGFCVGIVEREKLITPKKVQNGDVLIGLASSGLHSNGFSLIRRIMQEDHNNTLDTKVLLEPTALYVNLICHILQHCEVHGLAHITGGGLIENVPRAIPKELHAVIEKKNIPSQDIYTKIKALGIDEEEMWNTFNMGIGFVIIAAHEEVNNILQICSTQNTLAYIIGSVQEGSSSLQIQ